MPYIFLYLFLAVLCLLNMQFCPTGADIKKTMNRLHELRFVFAVLIIFSHCTNPFFPMPHILLPLSKISTLGVGYFFISSGFGLALLPQNRTICATSGKRSSICYGSPCFQAL